MTRVLAAGLVVAALAGCGGDKTNAGDQKTVDDAAVKTAAVRSYDVATSSSFKVPGAKKRVTFRGVGAFDAASHRGKLALDFTPLTPVTGQNIGTMLLVLDGATVYVKLPFLRQTNPAFKPWLKMRLEQMARAQAFNTFLQFAQGGDPSQTLNYLLGAGKATKKGTSKVRGVKTTRYEATVQLNEVVKRAPAASRSRVRRAIEDLLGPGQKLAVDTWLDDQGRVRRLQYGHKMALGTQRTQVAQRMEFFDFGTPVSILLPSRDQVTDLTVSGT